MASTDDPSLIDRREAIRRVSALLGGAAFIGGTNLLTACENAPPAEKRPLTAGSFTADDIAYLDEIAETILPETKTPGAKAAKTGAFMALMVTDGYGPDEQRTFRDGMRALDEQSRKANGVAFMQATPAQRAETFQPLIDLARRGLLHTPVEQTFSLGEFAQAVARGGQGKRGGKIIFRMQS